VIVVTDGMTFEGDHDARATMAEHGVELIEEKVRRFEGSGGLVTCVELDSGRKLPATRAFFSIAHHPRTDIAQQLGCSLDDQGYITVGDHGETSAPGVYAAGDVTPGEQLVQVAAAQGAIAGIACALSLRGSSPIPGAPAPGPDPEAELDL
jgi:thioredoxin reductase